MTEKKSPIVAAVLSFLIPGSGQIYFGERRKGVGFFLMAAIFAMLEIFLIKNNVRRMEDDGAVLIGGVSLIIFWIYNIYDAYNTANGNSI